LHSVAALHRACGALHWAIRMERRALICWTSSNGPEYRIQLMQLALDHAALGDHVSALACRKELALRMSRQNQQAAALRARLAAIEREAERRRYRANEERTHMQRLAVIGRLIAQTHHALNVPAEQALALAQRASMSGDDAAELKPLLGELSRTIDQAATLVNQLKLFSYRSTPQPMALSVGEALQSAWRGLAPHRGADARLAQLSVQDDAQPLQAWCDAQRLGIMLKLLLIELTQPTDSNDEPVRIHAHIEGGDGADVVLRLQTPCRQGAPPSGARSQPPPTTLGVLLCQEIAGEMGGALDVKTRVAASLCYQLRLPHERASVQHLSASL
jgi:C4-dicarboxylate-specific signal transduction histidine kinase